MTARTAIVLAVFFLGCARTIPVVSASQTGSSIDFPSELDRDVRSASLFVDWH